MKTNIPKKIIGDLLSAIEFNELNNKHNISVDVLISIYTYLISSYNTSLNFKGLLNAELASSIPSISGDCYVCVAAETLLNQSVEPGDLIVYTGTFWDRQRLEINKSIQDILNAKIAEIDTIIEDVSALNTTINNTLNIVNEQVQEINSLEAIIQELVDHPDIIIEDYWHKWDLDTNTYINTGIKAKGDAFTYEDFTQEQIDSLRGNGIESISLTETVGLVKTYTITYTDGTTDTFDVTDGADGHSPVITFVGTTIYVDGVAGADLQGEQGEQGVQGEQGDTGASAYEIYLAETTDDPPLTINEWGNLMTGILNVLNSI